MSSTPLAKPSKDGLPAHTPDTIAQEQRWAARRPHWLRDGRDTWIDFSLGFKGERCSALFESILRDIEQREGRKRARRTGDRKRILRTIEMIVANAFWARFFRTTSSICYFRKKDAYRSGQKPDWLTSGTLVSAIDALCELGYLRAATGDWGVFPGMGNSSWICIAPPLLGLLGEHRIILGDLRSELDETAVIRMRDQQGRIVTLSNDESMAESFRRPLLAYNQFLQEHDITLDVSYAELELISERMRYRALTDGDNRHSRRPEVFRTSLFRVFNGGWDLGGRFYGGWWQSIPKEWRCRIGIDGEPTVELDFAGFSVRALYHLRGLPYDDDPYLLDQFGNAGSRLAYRPTVKVLTQALINAAPGSKPELANLNGARKLPKGMKRRNVRTWIEGKHKPIADCFCAGWGLRLQSLDAAIAESVLFRAMTDNIVVLPIHDSFVVNVSDHNWLKAAMVDAYQEKIGMNPIITEPSM